MPPWLIGVISLMNNINTHWVESKVIQIICRDFFYFLEIKLNCYVENYCHNPNSTSTQLKRFDTKMTLHHPPPPITTTTHHHPTPGTQSHQIKDKIWLLLVPKYVLVPNSQCPKYFLVKKTDGSSKNKLESRKNIMSKEGFV